MRILGSKRSFEESSRVAEELRDLSHLLEDARDLDPLIERIGDARFVLMGEASHGTSDYYLWRALLSRRLILEKGFSFIAVEGDWPDCYEINRYIKGYSGAGSSAREVLGVFERWPTWMWANWEVAALTEWLRIYNQNRDGGSKVGFYGLDVYSLWESMQATLKYLEESHPDAVQTAYEAYRCFEPFGEDPQAYARSVAFVPETCESEVVQLLHEMRRKVRPYDQDHEAAFNAEQNAFVTVNAERYYRAMVQGGSNSWNVRDYHMADTLDRLMRYHGDGAKAIVWAHNTHVGDARATDMAEVGMVNIGELVRQRHEQDGVVLVGFGSYAGSVIAGRSWGAPMEEMQMPPAAVSSWEDVFRLAGEKNQLLLMDEVADREMFHEMRGHRAIGVVYKPEEERYGNYVPSVLPRRYDAFLYIHQTQALNVMHLQPDPERQPPALYPWGL